MEDFIWEEEFKVDAVPAEYYTKEEVNELLSNLYMKLAKAHNEMIDKINKNGSDLYVRMSRLVADFEQLKEAFKGMSEEVDRYLLPEKEERKKKALERLNSGFYDFEDDEEENFENLDENC